MMGVKSKQSSFIVGFSIEDKIPEDHLLRAVARMVDFSFVRRIARPCYSHTGSPSVDPVVILKMNLLGYLYAIPSERKLAEECRLNMAFLWFLGYGIDETPPDHSVLSKARVRFGRKVYEQFFNEIVKQCEQSGLVEGKRLFMDSTLLKANASLDSLVSRHLCRQVREKTRDYLDQVWAQNTESEHEQVVDEPAGPRRGPKKVSANEMRVSKTDPEAAMVRRKDTKLFLGHKLHVGVDGGKARIVTAVVATPGNVADGLVARSLVERHETAVGSRPQEAVADKGYGSIRLYRYLRNKGIKPSIPRARPWRKKREEKLKAGFRYDAANDVYVCPQGKKLYKQTAKTSKSTYKVHQTACKRCSLSQQVCKAKRPSLTHPADQALLNWVESHLGTYSARKSLRDRQIWPETVIAEIKNARGLRQARLRGVAKVCIEGLLASAAHDVLQMVKHRAGSESAVARVRNLVTWLRRCFRSPILAT